MEQKLSLRWFLGLSIAFVLLNGVMIYREIFWAPLLPIALLITYYTFTSIDKILYLIAFATPLSVNLSSYTEGIGMSLPSEPLMILVTGIFFLKVLSGFEYDKAILKHPVSIAIFAFFGWLLISSITSEIPLVSFKFIAARLWFIIPFYFFGALLFKKVSNIHLFIWLYVITLCIVIIYTTIRHSSYGFDENIGHWIMDPFYNDHTAYGAMIAFFIPVMTSFIFDKTYKSYKRLLIFVILGILLIGLYLSYCRAAWLGIAASIGIWVVIKLKIRASVIAVVSVSLISLFLMLRTEIIHTLEKNKQDASDNFVEHIQSMSNISTDASNLERLNRWSCAFRMFELRPVTGWGPGTYQFCYAPFQYSYERTIISTNAGTLGNAHSEYIGPLAETGLPGALIVVGLYMTILISGIRVYFRASMGNHKLLTLAVVLAFITYLIHGFLNNFLDTDKAAVPFWAFAAMIVALDLYIVPKKVLEES